jgi:hypothetical protein
MSDLIERAKNHLAHLESWNEYRTVDFGDGPESRGGEHTDTITIMSELVAALQPVEDVEVRAHIINIAGAYPKAAGALERLARENAEYEEGNDADAEVIQLLQAKVEELTKAITDFREGNYAHPRTYHPNDCPHGAHYWQDCANCDEGYWQSVLQEGE